MSARDGYEAYYAEKLWQLLPEVYRLEDGAGPRPHALRQIVELVAAEVAESRRSIDRLWEDQHIETCDDWAVPYLADLVGARLVSARDPRGRRVDVARAIHFRRRRGTPAVLDELVRSLTGWDVVLVEGFRRLARTRHRLDAPPVGVGPFTRTPPGGTADLRRPVGADLAGGPFEELFHTLDVRRQRGRDGRYGLRKLNFHLFPLQAFVLRGVDPVELQGPGPRTFTFDPSGRDVALFINGQPPAPDTEVGGLDPSRPSCGRPPEHTVTQPMRCRLLGHVVYEVTEHVLTTLSALPAPPLASDMLALAKVRGVRFDSEPALRRRLQDLGATIGPLLPAWYVSLVEHGLTEDCGKGALYPSQVAVDLFGATVPPQHASAAHLGNLACHPKPATNLERLLLDPERGRFATRPPGVVDPTPLVSRYVYGFSAAIGAGPYDRAPVASPAAVGADGVIPSGALLQGDGLRLDDDRTYRVRIESGSPVADAAIVAATGRRPYVQLSGDGANPRGANLMGVDERQRFVIDGGWYAGFDPAGAGGVVDFVVEARDALDTAAVDFDTFEIRNATFDPGGVRADGRPIPTLRLRVRAQIRELVIKRSIVGPIEVLRDGGSPAAGVSRIIVCDSIVDAGQAAGAHAIDNPHGEVQIERSTVFGEVRAGVLAASDSLLVGRVEAIDDQAGCLRFSATVDDPGARLPPRYRAVVGPLPGAYFGARRFGAPDYARLSDAAPSAIRRGAENGGEMGAFLHLLTPIRIDGVRAKLDELGPVGMLAQLFFEDDGELVDRTRAGAIASTAAPAPGPGAPDLGEVLPYPPPPPPVALPAVCPDGGPAPAPPAAPAEDLVPTLDLGGPPAIWTATRWRGDGLPELERATGVAFDPVSLVREYDARLGGTLAGRGWRSSRGEGLFDRGALRFEVGPDSPLELSLHLPMDPETLPLLHLAASLAFDAPRADRGPTSVAAHRARLGLRAADREQALGVSIDLLEGDDEALIVSPALPGDELEIARDHLWPGAGAWRSLGLQAHLPSRRAQAYLGELRRAARLEARASRPRERGVFAALAVSTPHAPVTVRLERLALSAPGRAVRAWAALDAPHEDPTLELRFEGPAGEGARKVPVAVCYGAREPGARPDGRPAKRAVVEVELDTRGAGAAAVRLEGVEAESALWLTMERPTGRGARDSDAPVRLVSGRWRQ